MSHWQQLLRENFGLTRVEASHFLLSFQWIRCTIFLSVYYHTHGNFWHCWSSRNACFIWTYPMIFIVTMDKWFPVIWGKGSITSIWCEKIFFLFNSCIGWRRRTWRERICRGIGAKGTFPLFFFPFCLSCLSPCLDVLSVSSPKIFKKIEVQEKFQVSLSKVPGDDY